MSKFAKSTPEWHYTDASDADVGPCSLADLRTARVEGALTDDAFVWHPTLVPDWTTVQDLPELKADLIPPAPPPKPARPPAPPAVAARPAVAKAGERPQVAARPAASTVVEKPVSPAVQAAAAASANRRKSQDKDQIEAMQAGAPPNFAAAAVAAAASLKARQPAAAPAAPQESKPIVAPRSEPRPAVAAPMPVAAKPAVVARPGMNASANNNNNNNNNSAQTSSRAVAKPEPGEPASSRPAVAPRIGGAGKPAPPGEPRPSAAAAAAPAGSGKPAAPSRPGGMVAKAKPKATAGGKGTGKKLGKLGGRTVGDWTEMSTADGVAYYHNTATGELTWDKPDAMKDKSELASESGSWVWVPDDQYGYVVAQLVNKRPDGRYDVVIESTGDSVTTKKGEKVYPLTKSSLSRTQRDLVLLDSLDEGLILHNLKERFTKQRQIYTNIGTILISINPYETFPIYTVEKIYEYRSRGNRVLDPHVYTIADEALTPLLEYGKGENHSILISGESGAGKTWNTKQALSYLTEVTSRGAKDEAGVGGSTSIEGRILAANPILEGFGNAKTIRNDNSSRFGRFTEVHFDKTGRIHGARIDNFLLEKSRVVQQTGKERNYHVFYQLCKSNTGKDLGLLGPEKFMYLNKTGVYEVPDVDDEADFKSLLQAFDEMGISHEETEWVMSLVAGVLFIGNTTFVSDGGEGSNLTKDGLKALDSIARLLHVTKDDIIFGFTHRTIEIKGETTAIPLKTYDAEASRDALAKSIYGQMFDWLVSRINVALNGAPHPWAFIGLLDIFGFEIFEKNSFEQLCINFTNEKLQQLFNRDTFQREQAMYRKEGVPFDEIKYIDNQPILDMIEKKVGGLLTILDDLNRMPKSTDEGFVAKADEANASNTTYYINSTNTRKGKTSFSIVHYAGTVVYDARDFLVKNKDLLYADLYDAMSRSKHPMTAQMFPPLTAQERSKYSLGAQFRQQLDKLMTQLNATQTHYIRCIKPNNDKAPSQLDPVLTLEQLRYSGVFEAVRIRKQGYPFRYTYERFVDRYKCLMLEDAKWVPLKAKQPRDKVAEILEFTGQDFSEIKMGATMALYRAEQHRLLELLRALALEKVCAMIQAIGRGYIARAYCRKIRAVVPRLEKAAATRDVEVIEKALADYARLVGTFAGLVPVEFAVVRRCKRIRHALKEWERLACDVDIIAQSDLSADENAFEQLKDCVWAMELLVDEPGSEWHMQMFDYAKNTFEDERRARLDPQLKEAMDLLERDQLTAVYAECKRLRFEDPRLEQIEKFVGMGEEELLKFQYKNAKKLHMEERAREKETRIRENFIDQHMDMFVYERFPRLRDPEEFASHSLVFWKRDELAASMLRWTKTAVNTSLTQLEPKLAKQAVNLHKALQGWCGDRNNPSPNSLAHEIITTGINEPKLRDEIYALIMKQLSGNESPQSVVQAWKMFALCLLFFPPNRDFADFCLVFLRNNAPPQQANKLRDRLYEREYEGPKLVPPSIDEIPSLVQSS